MLRNSFLKHNGLPGQAILEPWRLDPLSPNLDQCHYRDVFCAALLNSQPMGFMLRLNWCAMRAGTGVEVCTADVIHRDWETTPEPVNHSSGHAIHLPGHSLGDK